MASMIRLILTMALILFAFAGMPLLYIGVPLEWRHTVTVLDLNESGAMPLSTGWSLRFSQLEYPRFAAGGFLAVAAIAGEIWAYRRRMDVTRLRGEYVVQCVWGISIAVMYLLLHGIIAIIVTI